MRTPRNLPNWNSTHFVCFVYFVDRSFRQSQNGSTNNTKGVASCFSRFHASLFTVHKFSARISRPSIQCAPVAQWLEQQTHNLLVRGSNPCGGTNQPASSLTLTSLFCWADKCSTSRWREDGAICLVLRSRFFLGNLTTLPSLVFRVLTA